MKKPNLETEEEKILYKRRRLILNRNMCVMAGIVLAFNAYPLIKTGDAPLYFIILMSAILIGITAVGLKAHMSIKKINEEISERESIVEVEKIEGEDDI